VKQETLTNIRRKAGEGVLFDLLLQFFILVIH